MSRSNYTFNIDQWARICWRGAVKKAINGHRGQSFLKEMKEALDALPKKRLIAADLEREGDVCAIGSVGRARGLDMSTLDPEDSARIADAFGIADAMVREIEFINDEQNLSPETPESRYKRVYAWIESKINR